MKKIILLSLLLLFLTGCKQNNTNISIQQPIIESPKSFESFLSKDSDINKQPQITVSEGKWVILAEINSKVKNEISYTSTQEEKQNWRKESVVSGYIYTYIYKDLWLRISTPPLYPPYFFEKEKWLILKRNGNIIYLSWTTNNTPDYMEVFYKDPQTSFENEIKNKHLANWCIIETDVFDKNNAYYPSMNWFNVIYIENKDYNLIWDTECRPDKQFPQNELIISFVMDPKKPDRYYKFSKGDCAPWPCSIFGKIEFF